MKYLDHLQREKKAEQERDGITADEHTTKYLLWIIKITISTLTLTTNLSF